jgi:hypothetical protein
VLQLCSAATGKPLPNWLRKALLDERGVAPKVNIDLVRRGRHAGGHRTQTRPRSATAAARSSAACWFFARFVSSAREAAQRSAWEGSHDILTGLFNRREFENQVENLIADTEDRRQEPRGVLHGPRPVQGRERLVRTHAAGDELLKELVGLLRSRIRETDTLARLGGDEFGCCSKAARSSARRPSQPTCSPRSGTFASSTTTRCSRSA